MTGFQNVVEKILLDESFRVALAAQPAQTLGTMGIAVTPQILAAFEGVTADHLQLLARNFNESDAAR